MVKVMRNVIVEGENIWRIHYPIEYFTRLELQIPPIGVSELHKIRRSTH